MNELKITGKELFELFDEVHDQGFIIDQNHVDYVKEELEYDLSKFIGYEVEHRVIGDNPEHDMDNYDNIFTITTPDKKKYYIKYNTNLFRGNDFNYDKTYVLDKVISEENMLENLGWTITCESPFEMEHEDGSSATGQAAYIVKSELISNYEDYI